MSGFDEQQALSLIGRLLAPRGRVARQLELGIGDDAAVFRATRGKLVFTVDVNVEGVHFDRRWLSLEDVGWRALQAAVSDLAAMGARPLGALSSLILPAGCSRSELARLVRGQARAARSLGCPIVGGNLSRGTELSVTSSVLGVAERPLTRAGARAGDELWLIGQLGLARAGLLLLQGSRARRGLAARRAVQAWRTPHALLDAGRRLVGRARAAMDVSDGLARDAPRLAAASGVAVVVVEAWLEPLLSRELRTVAATLGLDPAALALEGGEDYALLAAGPAARRPEPALRIGYIERGRSAVLERPDGRRTRLRGGFDHFGRRG